MVQTNVSKMTGWISMISGTDIHGLHCLKITKDAGLLVDEEGFDQILAKKKNFFCFCLLKINANGEKLCGIPLG